VRPLLTAVAAVASPSSARSTIRTSNRSRPREPPSRIAPRPGRARRPTRGRRRARPPRAFTSQTTLRRSVHLFICVLPSSQHCHPRPLSVLKPALSSGVQLPRCPATYARPRAETASRPFAIMLALRVKPLS
jgi:hypothetical protein